MPTNDSFSLTNGFAMQYGAVLGLWRVAACAAFVFSFAYPGLSSLYLLMAVASPVLACLLTMRFRRHVVPAGPFTFGQGFLHTLLMGLYACVWVALAVYVYLAYFDGGFFFDSYAVALRRPELVAELERSGLKEQLELATGGKGLEGLVDAMRAITPATYSAMVIYLNIIIAPLVSLIVALLCRQGAGQRRRDAGF